MARHADPSDRSFQRSLTRAVVRGLLLVLGAAALVFAVGRLTARDDVVLAPPSASPQPVMTESPSSSVADTVSQSPRASVVISPRPSPTPSPTPAQEPTQAEQAVQGRPPAELRVQVLDGTGDDQRTQAVVGVLEELGYQVVAVNPVSVAVPATSVLYSDGFETDAQALTAGDPRFGAPAVNDRFSPEVDLHVLVGENWPQ